MATAPGTHPWQLFRPRGVRPCRADLHHGRLRAKLRASDVRHYDCPHWYGFQLYGLRREWIPIHVCATFPCRAGSTETATEVFTEGDQAFAGGSGTFKGTSFRIPNPSEGSTVRLKFTASFSVPSLFPTEPTTGPLEWTITTPFTFAGIIDPINLDPISLTGHGILTLSASTDGFPPDHGLYIMQSARFDFLSMPEPSSLVLIVSGLAALAALAAVPTRTVAPVSL